jgi:hypothetical protein
MGEYFDGREDDCVLFQVVKDGTLFFKCNKEDYLSLRVVHMFELYLRE